MPQPEMNKCAHVAWAVYANRTDENALNPTNGSSRTPYGERQPDAITDMLAIIAKIDPDEISVYAPVGSHSAA